MGEIEKVSRYFSDKKKVKLYYKVMEKSLGKAGKSAAEDLVETFERTGVIEPCCSERSGDPLPDVEVQRLATAVHSSMRDLGIFDNGNGAVVHGVCEGICTALFTGCMATCPGNMGCYAQCIAKYMVCLDTCRM